MFCKKPGAIWKDQSGDVACDHYNRWKQDVALMKSLGLQAYRLSISWPRVMPEGTGATNAKGLDFYDRLIDALLAAGITPWVTLYHWDLPLALYHRGGWLNRDIAGWFADYATLIGKRLGDRVRHFMPLNEPQVFLGAGLIQGRHAPGDKLRFAEFLLAAHNTLLAHGRSVQALRAACKVKPRIGTAQAGYNYVPATDSADDLRAARARYFATADDSYKQNAFWLDPMILGRYPEDGAQAVRGVDAGHPRRRHGDDQAAARFPGHDPLQRGSGAQGQGRQARGDPVAGGLPDHRVRVGGGAVDPAADPDLAVRTLQAPHRHRRKRPVGARLGRRPTAACTIPTASTSRRATCASWARRSRPASRSRPTSTGRSSTTSSGPRATSTASAWST